MLVNLTPHPVHIYADRSKHEQPVQSIAPSGQVARLSAHEVGSKIGYSLVEYGGAYDLPAPVYGVMYIVSLVVALAVRRDDLLAPYIEVRNDEGTMIGCRYLQKVV